MPLSVGALAAAVIIGGAAATGAVVAATATSSQPAMVTICHRTGSQTNPYVQISVSQDSADGDATNDHGRPDHYLEHGGPVGPTASGEWGDIIPPIPGVHDGLNWNDQGIAIYQAGCAASTGTTSSPTTSAPTTTTALTSTSTTAGPTTSTSAPTTTVTSSTPGGGAGGDLSPGQY